MKNIIFCFSGTGNSLAVAREISEKLGDTEIVMIAKALKEELVDLSYERVGFIFPAYYAGGLPPIIERFVEKLDFNKPQYVFTVITAGVVHGGSIDRLAGLIMKRGGFLNAGFPIRMPGNYIAMYGAWPKPIQRFLLKRAKEKTKIFVQSISEKRSNRTGDEKIRISKPLTERMNGYERFALNYLVTDKCTGCGLCVKICPMHNITMVNSKPRFGEHCERCMACIQWCPVKAIEYKDKTEKRRRYQNPDIKASDLFSNT